MKIIEILNGVVKKFGLTEKAEVKSRYENNQISADFVQELCPVGEKTTFQDVNLIPSKKFVTPKKIEPGMFYYIDGLIFPELIPGNQVSAIVGGVGMNYGLAIGLRETVLPWSSDRLYVDMSLGVSGKEATSLILEAAKKMQKNAEAAEWCAKYTFRGIKAGTGFMPSKEELSCMFANRKKLCQSFALCNSGVLSGDAFYWASSEYYGNDYTAWDVRPSDGLLFHHVKSDSYRVRCAVEFKI